MKDRKAFMMLSTVIAGSATSRTCFVLVCCFAKATLCDFSARAASRPAVANLHTTDSRDQENKLERSIPSATKFSHEKARPQTTLMPTSLAFPTKSCWKVNTQNEYFSKCMLEMAQGYSPTLHSKPSTLNHVALQVIASNLQPCMVAEHVQASLN